MPILEVLEPRKIIMNPTRVRGDEEGEGQGEQKKQANNVTV